MRAQTLKLVAASLAIAALAACKKEVAEIPADIKIVNAIADFRYTQDPNDPFKYTFKNLSQKYKKLQWRFGDDTVRSIPDPAHTYLKPGKYVVDLMATSETGLVSRKMAEIKILPDSVLRINVEKTGVTNQVRFGVTAKAPIASVLWTFSDVSPAVTSTELNPLRTYPFGTFNQVTAQITTTAGSVVSVSKNNFTTEGAVQDITLARTRYTTSAENTLAANESSPNVLDANVETKYTMGGKDGRNFNYPLLITLYYATPQTVKLYAISNSNDNPNRDPKTWRLEASNDGLVWEVLDTRTMAKNFFDQRTAMGFTTDADKYKKLFYYGVATPKPYTIYRWAITANWGDAAMQTNDLRLYK